MADPIIFRTADARWPGQDKGANLTAKEVDQNFFALLERIVDLEMYPLLPLEIEEIIVVGNQMTFVMSDGYTEFGPFTLPTAAMDWTGEWQPNHQYNGFEIFTYNDGLYMVKTAHESGATFIMGPEYQYLMPLPRVFDIGLFFPQKPGFAIPTGEPMMTYLAARSFYIPEDAPGTLARLRVAPADDLEIVILKNDTEIGYITFLQGETSAEIEFDTQQTFEAGDFLRILTPDVVDANAKDLSITFVARLGEPE